MSATATDEPTTPTWYLVQRNLHLDIPVTGMTNPFRLNFNRVLGLYRDAS